MERLNARKALRISLNKIIMKIYRILGGNSKRKKINN